MCSCVEDYGNLLTNKTDPSYYYVVEEDVFGRKYVTETVSHKTLIIPCLSFNSTHNECDKDENYYPCPKGK